MALLSPSIARLERPLDQCIQIINRLGCESVHVDVCQGFSLPNFLTLSSIQNGSLRGFYARVTLHLFRLFGEQRMNLDCMREDDLIVLHVFPYMTASMISEFLAETNMLGCRVGLAIDLEARLEMVLGRLTELDTVFVMGIPVATYGLQPDKTTLYRLDEVSEMIRKSGACCRIGLDGGVNIETFPSLADRVDELVIGSLLFNAPDVVTQWRSLQSYSRNRR